MWLAWRTVGAIITRVVADAEATLDRLEGLRRIGIDEISHRRGQRCITIVVDHESGRLVWDAEGRSEATLERFFDELDEAGCQTIPSLSAPSEPVSTQSRRARRALNAPRAHRLRPVQPSSLFRAVARVVETSGSRALLVERGVWFRQVVGHVQGID